jgi:hypothetical protein
MDKATKGTYLKMSRVVKFVIDTKNFCLQIKPEFKGKILILRVFCDSDWAGDSETRISVTGSILYLMNVPVCWRSKSQKGVTLSSTEAEYVAMSEAVKEVKFIYYLLRDIGIEVELPIIANQPVAGSHIVSACKVNSLSYLSVTMYGPMRSTHIVSQGLSSISLKDKCPYFLRGSLHL